MAKSLDDLKNIPPEGQQPPTPPTPPAGDPPTPPTPPTPPEIKLDDVRGKKPEELTATEKAFIQEHASELTDDEKKNLGIEVTPPTPPTPPANETPEEKVARLEKERDDAIKAADDAKKKFSSSSREAQVLGLREKELAKAQEEADALPEPTDDEMKALYPNWDEIDQLTKDLAKDRVLNKKKQEIIAKARGAMKDRQSWEDKVDQYVGNPQTLIDHPELEGKQDEFREFASKPTRRGLEFDDLILAFRGELASRPPSPNRGKQMFEPGGSRAPTPPAPKDDKLSPAEGEALRKTDYKKYVAMLKAGKIRNE